MIQLVKLGGEHFTQLEYQLGSSHLLLSTTGGAHKFEVLTSQNVHVYEVEARERKRYQLFDKID